MAEFPAMPLWTDAYLGDTRHLSTIQHGAYLLLLMIAWRSRDCDLPDDDRLLARYTGLTVAQWRRMRPDILAFFDAENGRLIQQRLRDERDAVRRKRESQAANGRASALKRNKRHSTKREPIANGASTPLPLSISTGSNEPIVEPNGSIGKAKLLPEHVIEIWNKRAEVWGLPLVKTLSRERRQRLAARIREHPLEDFLAAFDAIERSAFLRGENKNGWRADIDFFCQKSSFIKLVEGSYDH